MTNIDFNWNRFLMTRRWYSIFFTLFFEVNNHFQPVTRKRGHITGDIWDIHQLNSTSSSIFLSSPFFRSLQNFNFCPQNCFELINWSIYCRSTNCFRFVFPWIDFLYYVDMAVPLLLLLLLSMILLMMIIISLYLCCTH